MIDFSSNINAFVSSDALRTELSERLDVLFTYPDHKYRELHRVFADRFGWSRECSGIGVGSTQIIFSFPNWVPYQRAVIPVPTFWEYEHVNRQVGRRVKVVSIPTHEQTIDAEALLANSLRPGDAVFLCNVNNPTSQIYAQDSIRTLAIRFPEVSFILDETYLLFREDWGEQSLCGFATEQPNVHVVSSLSKFFAIPGLRLGVLVSDPGSVQRFMRSAHIPYGISPLASVAMRYIDTHWSAYIHTREQIACERAYMISSLLTLFSRRIKPIAEQGNFLCCRVRGGGGSQGLVTALRERDCLVRGGHELPHIGDGHVRFSIRTRAENDRLLHALGDALGG